jgi:hypothetical protein
LPRIKNKSVDIERWGRPFATRGCSYMSARNSDAFSRNGNVSPPEMLRDSELSCGSGPVLESPMMAKSGLADGLGRIAGHAAMTLMP